MNNSIKNVLVFSLGAAVGSVLTWRILKTRYEKKTQEEIDSVKEVFSRNKKEEIVETVETESTPDESAYFEKMNELATEAAEALNTYNPDQKVEKEVMRAKATQKYRDPYVISPDEFGELEDEGYDTETFSYYADGVLTDEMDNPVEDIAGTVGSESLTHFGDYEDDAVHVRNERLKRDYEILYDFRRFKDVFNVDSRGKTEG